MESDTKSIGGEIGKRSRLIGKKKEIISFTFSYLKTEKGKNGEREKKRGKPLLFILESIKMHRLAEHDALKQS